MKKIRILALVALLLALLIPAAVNAGGVFYCSTSITEDGTGSYSDPWMCSTTEELNTVINDYICDTYSGGYLYEIYPDSYRYHTITYYSADDCRITSTVDYAGAPPYTGVDIPTPLLVGAVALAGAGLVAGGLYLRRRKVEAV